MSLLPTGEEHDADELREARKTLLGPWILFTQHLVARMHELERAYGRALDALAGEAAVPRQVLSNLGPEGRATSRELAYRKTAGFLSTQATTPSRTSTTCSTRRRPSCKRRSARGARTALPDRACFPVPTLTPATSPTPAASSTSTSSPLLSARRTRPQHSHLHHPRVRHAPR